MRAHQVLVMAAVAGALAGPSAARDPKAASPEHGSNVVLWFAPSGLVAEANASLERGEHERAIRLSEDALGLVLGPGDRTRALAHLCIAHSMRHEHERALARCDELVHSHPPTWFNFAHRANARLQSGSIDGAIADYERALALLEELPDLEARAIGEEETSAARAIVERNLELARERRASGLSGVATRPEP